MNGYFPADLADLVQTLTASAPCTTNDQELRFVVFGMMNRAIARGLVWGADWSAIWPMSAGEWEGVIAELDGSFRTLADSLAKDMRAIMQTEDVAPMCLKTELDLAKAIGSRAHPIKLAPVAKLIDDYDLEPAKNANEQREQFIAVARAAYIAGWQAHLVNDIT